MSKTILITGDSQRAGHPGPSCSAARTESGLYFDNDKGQFASPHPDALDPQKSREIVRVIEEILVQF